MIFKEKKLKNGEIVGYLAFESTGKSILLKKKELQEFYDKLDLWFEMDNYFRQTKTGYDASLS